MPIYEYYCPECETTFEKRQSFNAEPVAGCDDCGYTGAKRKISAPAIVFKGSGFYVNDSRNSSKKNGHKNGSTNGKSAETSTEAKTETKTESESTAKESTSTKETVNTNTS